MLLPVYISGLLLVDRVSVLLMIHVRGLVITLLRLLIDHAALWLGVSLGHTAVRTRHFRPILDFGLHLCQGAREAEIRGLLVG